MEKIMSIKSRKTIGFLIFIGVIFFAFFATAWVILFTQFGASYVVKKISGSLSDKKGIIWQKNEGSLMSGMTYKDVVLEDLKWFPTPNKLKMQALTIDINSFGLDGITLNVENARLSLPNSEPIIFYGKI